MDFRTCRTITTPRVARFSITLGWECQRPFVALDKYGAPYDDEPDYFTDSRIGTLGGCRAFMGKGCEWECPGCFARSAVFEAEEDPIADDLWDAFNDDADSLADTIGHSARCPYPEDGHDTGVIVIDAVHLA